MPAGFGRNVHAQVLVAAQWRYWSQPKIAISKKAQPTLTRCLLLSSTPAQALLHAVSHIGQASVLLLQQKEVFPLRPTCMAVREHFMKIVSNRGSLVERSAKLAGILWANPFKQSISLYSSLPHAQTVPR